ncbi:MTH538 TIR-like domain (DUF1863) [uncultured Avibacterium sp.]|uniref:MTH538 TIR-like domain (DUF1863) n=1 Tax=uncultured Avibacterium sp. TaxID=1936169 RepID=A0A486X8X6_9PAST|nr:MTH538 TIR-like domain (DUF1863) [uncultured Avibacterium sp.]
MRRVFFSFHYKNDNWRVQTIKNIGVVDNQIPVYSNEWEEVRLKRADKIKEWIDENIIGCSCLVVLIGEETANREWVLYEIEKAWNDGKGVMGIYIHNLEDNNGNTSARGRNPFKSFKFSKKLLSLNIPVHIYNPLIYTRTFANTEKKVSQRWYEKIKENLADWVEEAIEYRSTHNYMITRR